MHELAICQALIKQVEQLASQHHAQTVVSIVVGIGALSGVEAQLLHNAFPIASAGTIAASAELRLEPLAIVVKCSQCGAESPALPNKLLCQQCGDWHTTVVSGDELLLMRIELDQAPQ